MTKSIRILIADDHAIVRLGLRALMQTEPGMELVGEAADGIEAVEQARALRPDVILLDLVMPRKDGLEALPEIKEACPDARILVLTSFAEDDKVFTAIKAGALGYLLKDTSPEDLLHAIHAIYRGEPSLDHSIARRLIHEIKKPPDLPMTETPLTERELQVLTLIARGLTNQQIAQRLVLSERTIRTHISNIFTKLHIANRTQAALYALREGLAPLDSN